MLADRFQGPESTGTWGIVSNNDVMVSWSRRLALTGGEAFVRHLGKPKDVADVPPGVVPKGWTVRWATPRDERLLAEHVFGSKGGFKVRRSGHGTQNFHRDSMWCYYTKDLLRSQLEGREKGHVGDSIGTLLVFDDRRELVAMSNLGKFAWEGHGSFLLHAYTDGTKEGLSLLFELLLYEARKHGADHVMGYVPKLAWLMEIFAKTPGYSRATKTEQWDFHWKNRDFAK